MIFKKLGAEDKKWEKIKVKLYNYCMEKMWKFMYIGTYIYWVLMMYESLSWHNRALTNSLGQTRMIELWLNLTANQLKLTPTS